jgi:small subunit ribosomal protein S9
MPKLPIFAKTVGRRKKAIANVELVPGTGKIYVKGILAETVFSTDAGRLFIVKQPFQISSNITFDANANFKGGGIQSQVRAVQLALARAIVIVNSESKSTFREYHCLTRNPRKKERRKYGLKKARKAPQFSKRLPDYILRH